MNKQEIATRIAELSETVQYHANLYYNKAKPELTDAEYDALVDELTTLVAELEKKDPTAPEIAQGKIVLSNVGAVPSYGKKVTHNTIMGSLDKDTKVAGIVEWYNKYAPKGGCKIVVTPKVDGCFKHDSKVMMANGEERPISEIKEGMSVLSFNEKTGKTEPKKVVSVLVRKSEPSVQQPKWMILKFTGKEPITCTVDHPFLTHNRGWVEAQNLNDGDQLVEPEFYS